MLLEECGVLHYMEGYYGKLYKKQNYVVLRHKYYEQNPHYITRPTQYANGITVHLRAA